MTKTQDEVFNIIKDEQTRQSEGLELIPSENYVSKEILQAMGSVLTNKYSEGYPGKRYYGGNGNVDKIEQLAIDRAKKLFHADHANVQPHSGANANEAVYFAWLNPGDTVLAMSLPAGGHLTHGSPVTRSAHIYNFIGYGVTDTGDIDYDDLREKAKKYQPKLILVGYSAFMKIPDFKQVRAIADEVLKHPEETLLMADMAHVAGLIAGGVHPNPLQFGFNVMTTTTHKTLRGPRGGMILSQGKVGNPLRKCDHTLENIPTLIDRAVFPGTQGGPLEHVIAAKAVMLGEDLQPEFKTYAKNIVKNAQTLAAELKNQAFTLQGDGTENHLILIDMRRSCGIDGKLYEYALDKIGLTLNANSLPTDTGAAFRPSGVRLGTPAMTTRGLGEPEMKQVALWMRQVADICIKAIKSVPEPKIPVQDANGKPLTKEAGAKLAARLKSEAAEQALADFSSELDQIHREVKALAKKFPLPALSA